VVREEDEGDARGVREAATEVTEDVRDGAALAGDEEGAAEGAGSGAGAEEEEGAAAGAGSDDEGAGEDTASGAADCVLRGGSEIDDTRGGRGVELCPTGRSTGGSTGMGLGALMGSFAALG
jgi:hypothetical protein